MRSSTDTLTLPEAEAGEISNTVWRSKEEKTYVTGWWDYEAAQWGAPVGHILGLMCKPWHSSLWHQLRSISL